MSVKLRIWLLPISAALMFAIGILIVLVFSSRTSSSIDQLSKVSYPFLAASTKFSAQLESLTGVIQSAVAEGEKRRLDEAKDKADAMRKLLGEMSSIPGKGEDVQKLSKSFENYVQSSTTAAAVLLGVQQGSADSAVPKMQASLKDLEGTLKQVNDDASTHFNSSMADAQSGMQSTVWVIVLTGLIVVAGLGGGSYLVIGGVWRQLGGEPEYARQMMRWIASGDLSHEVRVDSTDRSSLLSAVREMREGLASLVSQVRSGTDAISHASEEIASGNHDLSLRTEQQAAELERTSNRMRQLTDMVQRNADSARQADQLVASAAEVARRGGEVVGAVVETMGSIDASSKRIREITSVIDGIAFQTNILALNAAVEAARAGEQGRGFAVVAAEVRNLAQRSATAAKEISSLIGASVEQVENGSTLVQRAGDTMTEIVASVRRVNDIMGEITTASTEQAAGIADVGQAISTMDTATQQNAALVEEAAAAASSLEEQSRTLLSTVSTFKLP